MDNERLKASIIIPTYNRAKELDFVLRGLLDQDIDKSLFEIVVVDDNSSDEILLTIKKYYNLLNLIFVKKDDSINGAAKSRNIGIKDARNNLIIFLDSDVIPSNNFVRSHIELHKNAGNSVALGYVYAIDCSRDSWDLRFGKSSSFSFNDYLDFSWKNEYKWLFKDRRDAFLYNIGDDLGKLPAPWCFFWTLNASVLKENLEIAGLFDETLLKKGSEDLELGYRLYLSNLKFLFIRDSFGFHIPHCRDYSKEAKIDMCHEFYFLSKFPCIDIEALCTYDCGHTNTALPYISSLVESYNKFISDDIDNSIQLAKYLPSNGNNLLIGCTNEHLLEECNIKYVVEINPKKLNALKNKFPKIQFYNLIGTALPFENHFFDTIIFNDAWRCYSDRFLPRILDELLRIGKKLILIKKHKWMIPKINFINDNIDNNDNPYWSEFIDIPRKISNFNISLSYSDNDYSLYEVTLTRRDLFKSRRYDVLNSYYNFINISTNRGGNEE